MATGSLFLVESQLFSFVFLKHSMVRDLGLTAHDFLQCNFGTPQDYPLLSKRLTSSSEKGF